MVKMMMILYWIFVESMFYMERVGWAVMPNKYYSISKMLGITAQPTKIIR